MNREFTETMFLNIRNTANRQGYHAEQVNQNCIFIYADLDDCLTAYILTQVGDKFVLSSINNDGTQNNCMAVSTELTDVLDVFENDYVEN